MEQSAGLQILTNDPDSGQIRHIPETDPAQIRQSPENSPPAINQAPSAEYNTLHSNAMDHSPAQYRVRPLNKAQQNDGFFTKISSLVMQIQDSMIFSSLTKVLFRSRS
jgi:hypothetical protein